jgi:hypothetical protein
LSTAIHPSPAVEDRDREIEPLLPGTLLEGISTVWMMGPIAVSVFVAWLLKSLVLRLGGISLYRQLQPLFIGFIIGFFLGIGIAYGIDVIWFFGKGHGILHG